jgi:GPH family glycoside/pentoside/hexuronide:cation symporter
VAPVALAALTDQPFAAFAVGFAVLALVAVWAMRRQWAGASAPHPNFGVVLRDATARRLLLLALVNAAPVAVTSTLFLFYVESRLAAPDAAGPLLLLFFLSAAASAPLWSRLATRHGAKRILLAGMVLAVVTFGFAIPLGAGDTAAFALVCVASGAALGADMTLLPAIFARHLAQEVPEAGPATAFGLWSFVSKLSLALAAATLLPILQAQGFTPGAANAASALSTLSLLYAALPCVLKLLAIALLAATPVPEA